MATKFLFNVTVLDGSDVQAFDYMSKGDPYVVLRFLWTDTATRARMQPMCKRIRTTTAENQGLTPKFNEVFSEELTTEDLLLVQVYEDDHQKNKETEDQKNQLIGSAEISLREMVDTPGKTFEVTAVAKKEGQDQGKIRLSLCRAV
ncbi:C2 domain-containing protein [Baffinella frigidus]|nr:C2 domain-containing protein [Cryptophyta sp. CCMP2293]|eukprot:CAMPEP_0180142688 /NCGR_PEP_ID=MMETSP0986-20121125/15739_1 /TAXON_ID=697907 /ORGANISM="non described non described, Strain CCMP2293" /LENGTH=145 /DNA_ID=CAMNT_0022085953 /DNA_START=44 /DNA_END=481 /DNA_ORIENTATION=+